MARCGKPGFEQVDVAGGLNSIMESHATMMLKCHLGVTCLVEECSLAAGPVLELCLRCAVRSA